VSSLHDSSPTVPDVPVDVPHPSWCDPRLCRISIRGDGLEPLLVHEGCHYRDQWRSVVLMQCEVVTDDLTRVVSTCQPMIRMDGRWDDTPHDVGRTRDIGYALWTAPNAAERGALPFVVRRAGSAR
jgi:hypothetical protein